MDMSEILSDLDDHGFTDTSTARKMEAVNESYWDANAREPWPHLEKTVTLTFNGGSAPTNMPADFRAATSVVDLTVGGIRIKHMRHDEFVRRYKDISTLSGNPQLYYFVADVMRFWPLPTSAMTVTMGYIITPSELASSAVEANISIPKQFHRGILVNGALYRLYAMEDDFELAAGFERYYEKTIQNMRDSLWRRQYTDPDIIYPIDPDDVGWEGP